MLSMCLKFLATISLTVILLFAVPETPVPSTLTQPTWLHRVSESAYPSSISSSVLKNILKNYFVYVCGYLKRPGEGTGYSGVGVASLCKVSKVGAKD